MVSVRLGAREMIREGFTGTRTVRPYSSMTSRVAKAELAGREGFVCAGISGAEKTKRAAQTIRARRNELSVESNTNLP